MSSPYTIRAEIVGQHVETGTDSRYAAELILAAMAHTYRHVTVTLWSAGTLISSLCID